MQYLKKKCPNCNSQKLYDDSDGELEDYSEWICCENCDHDFSFDEIGVEIDGTFGHLLEDEYIKKS